MGNPVMDPTPSAEDVRDLASRLVEMANARRAMYGPSASARLEFGFNDGKVVVTIDEPVGVSDLASGTSIDMADFA